MYRTGDQAWWSPERQLKFIGRRDNQVKIRGHRVELEEVEAVLMTHPEVRHAAATVREAASGQQYLAAYVVLQPGGTGISGVRKWLRRKLPEYMMPGSLVQLEHLPLNSNGKIDRKALPDPMTKPDAATDENGFGATDTQ